MKEEGCGELAARELDRVDGFVAAGSLEAKAAAYWRKCVTDALEDLADPDRARALEAEATHLVANLLPRTEEIADKLFMLYCSLENGRTASRRLCLAWYGAWALRLVVEGHDRAAVLAELAKQPWEVKYQVLTRWA